MKKFALFLASVVACSASAGILAQAAESEKEEKLITFRGIDWYSTRADAEAMLAANGIEDQSFMSDRHMISRISGVWEWTGKHDVGEYMHDAGWAAMYSGATAGGYAPSYTEAYFMYTVSENGEVIRSDDDALLYGAVYEYRSNDFEDMDAVFADLQNKMSLVYGDSEALNDEYHSRYVWTDSEGNTARLIKYESEKNPSVSLAYEAADAKDRLDQLQDAIDAETRKAQESERLANASNTEGL